MREIIYRRFFLIVFYNYKNQYRFCVSDRTLTYTYGSSIVLKLHYNIIAVEGFLHCKFGYQAVFRNCP